MTRGSNLRSDIVVMPFSKPSDFYSFVYCLLFSLVIAGYPLSGVMTSIFAQGQQTISIAFRVIIILISFFVLYQGVYSRRVSLLSLPIMVFFVALSIRIYYDYVTINNDDVAKIIGYYFGTVLIPTIAISCCMANYNSKMLPISLILIAGSGCTLIFITRALGFAAGADIGEQTGRLYFESLNPTQIAYAGFAVFASTLALWSRSPLWVRAILIVQCAIAALLMVDAASRGPLVALVLSFGFIAWSQKRFLLLALLLMAGAVLALFVSDSSLVLVDRLTTSGVDQSSIERLEFIQSNFLTAIENPLFGAAYVDPVSQNYPHLTVLESAVAIGVGGAALMLFIQWRMLLDGLWLGKHRDLLMTMMVIAVLVQAYLSGSIWQSADFWAVAGLSSAWVTAARRSQHHMLHHAPAGGMPHPAGTQAESTLSPQQ